MTKKISQRSAIKLKRRVKELETQLEYSKDVLRYGWGTWIEGLNLTESSFAKVKVANLLGHAVLITPSGTGTNVAVKAVKYV